MLISDMHEACKNTVYVLSALSLSDHQWESKGDFYQWDIPGPNAANWEFSIRSSVVLCGPERMIYWLINSITKLGLSGQSMSVLDHTRAIPDFTAPEYPLDDAPLNATGDWLYASAVGFNPHLTGAPSDTTYQHAVTRWLGGVKSRRNFSIWKYCGILTSGIHKLGGLASRQNTIGTRNSRRGIVNEALGLTNIFFF